MASPSPSHAVDALRIQKGSTASSSSSPTKMSGLPRALSEIAPTEMRRNSPSLRQNTKMSEAADSSPFQSSPFNASIEGNASPRLFWQSRSPGNVARFNENMFQSRESSPSPTRRSSIEKLQKASRVRNSNMFAREMKQEYDPTSVPLVERPLAKQLQGNAYGGAGIEGLRSAERPKGLGHHRNNSTTSFALYSPTQTPTKSYNKESLNLSSSPTKDQGSPTKSSLSSRFKSSLDSNESDDTVHDLPAGKGLHRHAKSVTFDAAPPQINEYEMATPDPSSVGTGSRENSYDSFEDDEEGYGYEHDSYDIDDSFDASLEDTDKTPVMGPDDWRHDSASDHSQMTEGPEGSPMPDARPSSVGRAAARTDSLNSTGSHRPLPPLPGNVEATRVGSSSSVIWTAPTAQRGLPLPPSPDVVTRTEHPEKGGATMTLEERLKLMMIDDKPRSAAEQQRERRLRRAGVRNSQTPERDTGAALTDEEDTIDDLPGIETYKLPPRISRESILRKVNSQSTTDTDDVFSSPMPSPSNDRVLHVDPDTPLPTTELQEPADDSADDDSVVIKPEHGEDDDVDVYDIPEMYRRSESRMDLYEDAETGAVESVDSESQYSEPLPRDASQPEHLDAAEVGNDGTPEAKTPMAYAVEPPADHKSLGLPEFSAFELNNDFGQSLQTYMSPSSPQEVEVPVTSTFASSRDQQPRTSISSQGRLGSISQAQELLRRSDTPEDEDTDSAATSTESLGNSQLGHKRMSMTDAQEYLRRPHTPEERVIPAMPEYDGAGWGPEDDESDPYEVSTPESVIHHSTASSVSPPPVEPSFIPEREATIKASGSKLRTRASATPADIAAMRDIRRQVSVGAPEVPEVPPVPERHRNRPSLNLTDAQGVDELQAAIERHDSFKKKSLTLDIGSDLGLSLDKDFDRVIEAQKRGYLMRQNTKLVVASSHDRDEDSRATRSCGNSPAKRERPSTWTVEPWNGQIRKPSNQIRSPRKKTTESAAPPLPGQQSNVAEVHMTEETAAVSEDAGERGRLFVKVIGVKDLDLPLPRQEQTWFSLTLDNGVHCVTTAWLELGRNAPVGQEFELVVPQELEFQLTLNAKLEKPVQRPEPPSPTKFKTSKTSTFSRVFASPKKRKELEMKQKEEEERVTRQKQRESQAHKLLQQPTAWDLLSPLAAEDGSFGRSYVCLKDHESYCFGRPYTVDIACFNEWATEEVPVAASVMSKRGATQLQRRAPYKVAKLELQLLFVPKPKGASDDDMPKSLNSCIREMKEAELALARSWEGHLSQQGGDCPYWRRRFFRLAGSKLTAYHESTRQPRATINLANASKLIDDRRTLTQRETGGKNGKRRKSGFAEEEEGYMFVEEGFRIRFNNGEVIDFYADTAADKDGWLKVLDACIGKENEGSKKGWCDVVLNKEQSQMRKASGSAGKGRQHLKTKSMIF